MKEINGPETYKAIAQALPWELQTTLLSLRDAQEDSAALEDLYYEMPITVYMALQQLCLATAWVEEKRNGLKLTTAGMHLANYCTC